MTTSNGSIFRVTGPLCEEFTGHRWIPLAKANDTNDLSRNREAGDLTRHRAHCDVIVMPQWLYRRIFVMCGCKLPLAVGSAALKQNTVKYLIWKAPNHKNEVFLVLLSLPSPSKLSREDVVGAAPKGDAPTTSVWSTISLPTKVSPYIRCLMVHSLGCVDVIFFYIDMRYTSWY